MQKIEYIKHRFRQFRAHAAFVRKRLCTLAALTMHGQASLSPRFWRYIDAFDLSCQQIDPIIDYRMSDTVGYGALYCYYCQKLTPDNAIYRMIADGWCLGSGHGASMDGKGRTAFPMFDLGRWRDGRDGNATKIKKLWDVYQEKAFDVALQRKASRQLEEEITNGFPLEVGLKVTIRKTLQRGYILQVLPVIKGQDGLPVDPRPMYRIRLDYGDNYLDDVYCRAIDLTWEGMKRVRERSKATGTDNQSL